MGEVVDRERVLRLYERHYNPAMALMFEIARCPVETIGRGTYVRDEVGDRYLDIGGAHGIFGLGHCHPRVRAAVLHQLETLPSAPPQARHEPGERLKQRLAELLPGDLDHVQLAGSGSEAIEIAIRTALLANPERTKLVSADQGYHGKTLGALGIIGLTHLRSPFAPLWPHTQQVRYGDVDAMRAAIGDGAAAVVIEPILGGGTIEVPPPGYLCAVRELCDRTGTLLIVDEVQTGLGRTGTMFGVDHAGIVPDVVVLSKTLTGGHVPIAATVTRRAVADAVASAWPDEPYGSDSAGWPVVAAAALAALDVVIEEQLPARAARLGRYLNECLGTLAHAFPDFVVDAPGIGLMSGLRVRSRVIESALWLQLLRRNVIVGLSLNAGTTTPVLRAYPPLTTRRRELDHFVETLHDSLATLRRKGRRAFSALAPVERFQFRLSPRTLALAAEWVASAGEQDERMLIHAR